MQGWVLVVQGQEEEGITQMRRGMTARQATGAPTRAYVHGLLAEGYRLGGQPEEGLAVIVEALAVADNTGERGWEAEVYRLKGELLLVEAEVESEAEACFRQAVDIARRQQAKSWELRATVSLCRLWQRQGKKEQARQMLAEIYGWFTEGFDTADLKEAKALLEGLS